MIAVHFGGFHHRWVCIFLPACSLRKDKDIIGNVLVLHEQKRGEKLFSHNEIEELMELTRKLVA